MKNPVVTRDDREELLYLKRQIEITEGKLELVGDGKLWDALCYELLGLKARLGYLFDRARS